jgi:hypothetical protein
MQFFFEISQIWTGKISPWIPEWITVFGPAESWILDGWLQDLQSTPASTTAGVCYFAQTMYSYLERIRVYGSLLVLSALFKNVYF